jgi:hypothetical protein
VPPFPHTAATSFAIAAAVQAAIARYDLPCCPTCCRPNRALEAPKKRRRKVDELYFYDGRPG